MQKENFGCDGSWWVGWSGGRNLRIYFITHLNGGGVYDLI